MLNDPHSHGLWERTAAPAPSTTALEADIGVDVVVIGAGYAGLSTALHLSQAGRSVAVIEAVDIGFGGAGRNVGLVNAGVWIMPDLVTDRWGPVFGERLTKLLGDAPSLVFDLIAAHAIECEAMRSGTLHCGVGRDGYAQLEQRAAQWHARGARVQLLNADEAAARTGSTVFSGALFDPRAGTIQPLGYARGLARAAMTHGARIFTDTPALSSEKSQSGWIVRTPKGSVRAAWIVVATDAYSSGPWQVVRDEQVHLPYFNLATRPLDSTVLESILPRREGAWDTRQVLSSFRLDAQGRLVFGSVGSLRGNGARIHEAWARRAIRKIFPQLGEVAFEFGWFGHIGTTSDSLPRFHVFAPNVVGFSGYNGRGIAPGTIFGRVLADFIGGKIQPGDLPLPISKTVTPVLRSVREAGYSLGSQAVHLTGARL